MYLWNTDEGGPCVLRPTSEGAYDNPAAGTMSNGCVSYVDADGQCVMKKFGCNTATCDENHIQLNARTANTYKEPVGQWTDSLSTKEKGERHNAGFNNQFAFPWEIGFYYDFTVSDSK